MPKAAAKKKPAAKKPPASKNEDSKLPDQTPEADSIRDTIRHLLAVLGNERKLLNQFQICSNKIDKEWEMEKKMREEKELEYRKYQRQKQELEERQHTEIKEYQRKVKHLLRECQSNITDSRTKSEVALTLVHTSNREQQGDLKEDQSSINRMIREKELSHLDLIKNLKQDQEKRIMAMRQEYERKLEELKQTFQEKIKVVRKDYERRRKKDIKRIEQRKDAHIMELKAKHKAEFEDIKSFYEEITDNNIDLIKTYKDDVLELRNQEHDMEKDMTIKAQENRARSIPLKKHIAEVQQLRTQQGEYEKDKQALAASTEKLANLNKEHHSLSWEHEILAQKYEKAEAQYSHLLEQMESRIHDVQQKSGFKNLLLEKKLSTIGDDLEKKETALHELLVSTNLQPQILGEFTRSLEDVLMEKNKRINDLEDMRNSVKQDYYNAIHTFESKLDEFGVPVSELGFRPKQH